MPDLDDHHRDTRDRPLPTAADAAFRPLAWRGDPAWIRPDYARALVGVIPATLALLGHRDAGQDSLLRHLPTASPRAASRVLMVCLDGMGFKELGASPRLARRWGRFGTWITSVFPSITSTALTSLYSGLPPARHGLPGHVIWSDLPGAVVDTLSMRAVGARASLQDAGVDVRALRREPGLLEQVDGLEAWHLLPRHIAGSGLSAYSHAGMTLVGYGDLLEGVDRARRLLSEIEAGWVSLYTPQIDTLAHVLGDEVALIGLALEQVDRALGWLAGVLPAQIRESTAVVLATDHGHCPIVQRVVVPDDLERDTRGVGFSGRVLHAYAERDPVGVAARLARLVGERGQVLAFDEVRELLGPAPEVDVDALRRSVGDVVAVLAPGVNWDRRDPRRHAPPHSSPLASQHGGMSWDEMVVPLVVAPLASFA